MPSDIVKWRVCSVVEGTLWPHCKPRHDAEQKSSYSGHKRTNGIKFQGVVLPNGIISDLWGPVVGRRDASYLLRSSTLNNRLAAAQLSSGTTQLGIALRGQSLSQS
ncbi:unnamed protein product [Discosporangium mesarthrocarpum]